MKSHQTGSQQSVTTEPGSHYHPVSQDTSRTFRPQGVMYNTVDDQNSRFHPAFHGQPSVVNSLPEAKELKKINVNITGINYELASLQLTDNQSTRLEQSQSLSENASLALFAHQAKRS